MEAVNPKERLIQYINNADEGLLHVVKAVIESYKDNEIVAYSVDGDPLTQKQYHRELMAAEEEVAQGEFISQEDLEHETETW